MIVHKKCIIQSDLDGVVFDILPLLKAVVWRTTAIMLETDDFSPDVHGEERFSRLIVRKGREQGRGAHITEDHLRNVQSQLRDWQQCLSMAGVIEPLWKALSLWAYKMRPLHYASARTGEEVCMSTASQMYWLGMLKGITPEFHWGKDKLAVLEELSKEGDVVVLEDDPITIARLASSNLARAILVPAQPWNTCIPGMGFQDVYRMSAADVAQLLMVES